MILYTEEALDEIDANHSARPNLDRVLKAATRASNVIAKLLAFSRPMADRPPEPVDLAVVAHEAIDLSQALIPANVELKREIGSPPERVLGDATLLNQVIMNLCSNAVQAMRDGGGTLTVTVRARDRSASETWPSPASRVLELRVTDTGHGMNLQTQGRVFEPFFTTREVGEGSGLGLSISKRVREG